MDYNPIYLLHKSISKEELTTLYTISDVCLVSSTRDGMNLVTFEYVACQDTRTSPGSLIVSRHAGVSELMSGPLIVNPWDNDEVAEAIHESLTMSLDERRERHSKENEVVQEITRSVSVNRFLQIVTKCNSMLTPVHSFYWGRNFYSKLKSQTQE